MNKIIIETDSSHKQLEERVNVWLAANSGIKILSIQYTTASKSDGAAPGWSPLQNIIHVVFIAYQTKQAGLARPGESKAPMKINRPTEPQSEPIIIPKGQLPIDNSLTERG